MAAKRPRPDNMKVGVSASKRRAVSSGGPAVTEERISTLSTADPQSIAYAQAQNRALFGMIHQYRVQKQAEASKAQWWKETAWQLLSLIAIQGITLRTIRDTVDLPRRTFADSQLELGSGITSASIVNLVLTSYTSGESTSERLRKSIGIAKFLIRNGDGSAELSGSAEPEQPELQAARDLLERELPRLTLDVGEVAMGRNESAPIVAARAAGGGTTSFLESDAVLRRISKRLRHDLRRLGRSTVTQAVQDQAGTAALMDTGISDEVSSEVCGGGGILGLLRHSVEDVRIAETIGATDDAAAATGNAQEAGERVGASSRSDDVHASGIDGSAVADADTSAAAGGLSLIVASLAAELERERVMRMACEQALDRIEHDHPGVTVSASSIAPPKSWSEEGGTPRLTDVSTLESARADLATGGGAGAVLSHGSSEADRDTALVPVEQCGDDASRSGTTGTQAPDTSELEAQATMHTEERDSLLRQHAEEMAAKDQELVDLENKLLDLEENASLQKQLADGRLVESSQLRQQLQALEDELRGLRSVDVPDSTVRQHAVFKSLQARLTEAESQLAANRSVSASLRVELEQSRATQAASASDVESGLALQQAKLDELMISRGSSEAELQRQLALAQSRIAQLERDVKLAPEAILAAQQRSMACDAVQDRARQTAEALQKRMQDLRTPQGQSTTGDGIEISTQEAGSAIFSQVADLQSNIDALTEMIESTAQDYTSAEEQCGRLRKLLGQEEGRRAASTRLAAAASQEAKLARDALEAQQVENAQLRGALQQAEGAVQSATQAATAAQAYAQDQATHRAGLAADLDGAQEAIKSLQRLIQAGSAARDDASGGGSSGAAAEASDLRERLAAANRAEQEAREVSHKAQGSASAHREEHAKQISVHRKEVRKLQKSIERLQASQRKAQVGDGASSSRSAAASGGTNDEGRTRLLAHYKRVLRCPVRTDLFKDAVLTTCWHCFSEPALENLIRQRKRSCPSCGKRFGAGDVHKIFMTEADIS